MSNVRSLEGTLRAMLAISAIRADSVATPRSRRVAHRRYELVRFASSMKLIICRGRACDSLRCRRRNRLADAHWLVAQGHQVVVIEPTRGAVASTRLTISRRLLLAMRSNDARQATGAGRSANARHRRVMLSWPYASISTRTNGEPLWRVIAALARRPTESSHGYRHGVVAVQARSCSTVLAEADGSASPRTGGFARSERACRVKGRRDR